jgi:hypothetical protein
MTVGNTARKVYAIVEGHGEADSPRPGENPAVTILMVKLLRHAQCYQWFAADRPWRMSSCGDFYPRTENLLDALEAHRHYDDCACVLVLFDLDDDCPAGVAPCVADRIRQRGSWPFSVVVVCAHREYESWFLASLDTIHASQTYAGNPESLRDAKGWLRRRFGYKETRDQADYTRGLDIARATARSRSFRRLCHAFQQIQSACQGGTPIVTP